MKNRKILRYIKDCIKACKRNLSYLGCRGISKSGLMISNMLTLMTLTEIYTLYKTADRTITMDEFNADFQAKYKQMCERIATCQRQN